MANRSRMLVSIVLVYWKSEIHPHQHEELRIPNGEKLVVGFSVTCVDRYQISSLQVPNK